MPHPTGTAQVQVRFWAAARAATGVDAVTLDGDTVGDVLDLLVPAYPALERVLAVASVLVDGRRVDRETPLADGAVVEILPPFAGG